MGRGGGTLLLILGRDEDGERAGLVASCLLSLSPPSNSRPVLQSINPDEPHTECPNPKPGTRSGPSEMGQDSPAEGAPFGLGWLWRGEW